MAQLSHVLTGFDSCFQIWVFGTKRTVWSVLKYRAPSVLGVGDNDFHGLISIRDVERDVENLDDGRTEVIKFGEECSEPMNIRDHAKHFAACVARGGRPLATLEDGLKSVELSLAAKTSAREGRIVAL